MIRVSNTVRHPQGAPTSCGFSTLFIILRRTVWRVLLWQKGRLLFSDAKARFARRLLKPTLLMLSSRVLRNFFIMWRFRFHFGLRLRIKKATVSEIAKEIRFSLTHASSLSKSLASKLSLPTGIFKKLQIPSERGVARKARRNMKTSPASRSEER